VQTRNNKNGRPRKVTSQGKAKVGLSGKAVISHAGMALVSRALEHFSEREDLQHLSADLDPGEKTALAEDTVPKTCKADN
jgi:hypothetical protein